MILFVWLILQSKFYGFHDLFALDKGAKIDAIKLLNTILNYYMQNLSITSVHGRRDY
jgi:hypothetical protein